MQEKRNLYKTNIANEPFENAELQVSGNYSSKSKLNA
jgi:hypothetical protein